MLIGTFIWETKNDMIGQPYRRRLGLMIDHLELFLVQAQELFNNTTTARMEEDERLAATATTNWNLAVRPQDPPSPRPHPTARRKSSTTIIDPEAKALKIHEQQAIQQYGRGKKVRTGAVKDRKLRARLKVLEEKNKEAALRLKDAEVLLEHDAGFLAPEGEMEETYRVRQDDIKQDVDVETAKKGFALRLEEIGPYGAEYSRNGRQLLLFGRKGHVSSMDWRTGRLGFELQLGETVRDAKFLHTENMVAVAQKKYVENYHPRADA
jgi:hypothetical protein